MAGLVDSGAEADGLPSEDAILGVIVGLFAREFELTSVAPDAHFLFLGGDSMNAETLMQSIADHFGIRIHTATLLDAPTPQALSRVVAEKLRRKAATA